MTIAEARPRGVTVLLASPARAVAITILAGGAISLQSYVNGRLGKDFGSPTIAAAINNMVAFVATLDRARDARAARARVARLRALGRPPAGSSSAGSAALRWCSSRPRRRRRSAWRC